MCHTYTWSVVGTNVDMSSAKWCQMDCDRWFWAWPTLLPLGEGLNSSVEDLWSLKFEKNMCPEDKKYGNEPKLWRSVVEIMAIVSVESKMYFLLWPRTCLSNPLSSKPSSIKKAWIWINQQQHHCHCSGLHTTCTSLPCYVTHVLHSLPTPPLNFPKKSHWPRRLCSLCPFSNHKVSINHGSPRPQTSFPPTPGGGGDSGPASRPASCFMFDIQLKLSPRYCPKTHQNQMWIFLKSISSFLLQHQRTYTICSFQNRSVRQLQPMEPLYFFHIMLKKCISKKKRRNPFQIVLFHQPWFSLKIEGPHFRPQFPCVKKSACMAPLMDPMAQHKRFNLDGTQSDGGLKSWKMTFPDWPLVICSWTSR